MGLDVSASVRQAPRHARAVVVAMIVFASLTGVAGAAGSDNDVEWTGLFHD